jgi:rhodanese-related sulfurtransferase
MNYLLFFTALLLVALPAQAIPPPEFLLQAGASLAQVWAIGFLFLASGYVVFKRWLMMASVTLRASRLLQFGVVIGLVVLSGLIAYGYTNFKEPYTVQSPLPPVVSHSSSAASARSISTTNSNSSAENSVSSIALPLPKQTLQEDKYITFLKQYYQYLSYGELESAYNISTKEVPYDTYFDWYKAVLAIQVEDVQKLAPRHYSVVVALRELFQEDRYLVDFKLDTNADGEVYMLESNVNELYPISAVTNEEIDVEASKATLTLPNDGLQLMLDNGANMFVLDAREDTERAIGQFPGSTHIRAADLVAGAWQNIPRDIPVVVYCWSGMRGLDVAKFLQDQGLTNVSFLEEGAKGWVDNGGVWDGTIEFNQHYNKPQYARLLEYPELVNAMADGVTLIDSRLQERYDAWSIPGSVNLPMMYSSSSEITNALNTLPTNSTFISVCDDFISCFDARLVGIRLEQEGHTFIGRYNKPWEYRLNN